MKYICLSLVFLVCTLISSCSKKPEYYEKFNPNTPVAIDTAARKELAAGYYNILFPFGGVNRKFIIQLPAGFNEQQTYPVVFAFHGSSVLYTDMPGLLGSYMDAYNYIGIYPSVQDSTFNFGVSNLAPTNDTGFVTRIIRWVNEKTNVRADAHRFYATGFDQGGAFTHYLGLQTSLFAAIAPISASLADGMTDNAVSGLHTPVMQVHGDQDDIIPYQGGTGLLGITWKSAQGSIAIWAAHNGCGNVPETDTLSNGMYLYSYPVFVGAAESDLLVVPGAGTLYDDTSRIDVQDMIWQFFGKHVR